MAELRITLVDEALPAERLDDLASDLWEEIGAYGEPPGPGGDASPAPAGTRGTELVEVGLVVLQLAADAGLLAEVVRRVGQWRERQAVRHVEIEIGEARLVLSDVSAAQQQDLIDHFVRVTTPGPGGR